MDINNRAKILGEMCFDESLVALGLQADTNLEAIEKLSLVLIRENMVKESFTHAVVEREKIYATGLELLDMGIAIPHTDAEHVKEPAIALGILEKPVKFCGMGEPDKQVEVEVIFMLAIKEAHAQLQILQALLKVFQKEGKLNALKSCKTANEAADLLAQMLNG